MRNIRVFSMRMVCRASIIALVLTTVASQAQNGTTNGTTNGNSNGTTNGNPNGNSNQRYPDGTRTRQPPKDEGHGPESRTGETPHDSSNGAAIGAAVGGAAAAVLITELFMHHDSAEKLADHGPEVPKQLDMNGFAIKGVARPGWPFVVDYVLSAPGVVEVSVIGEHKDQFTCTMESRERRRGYLISNLPDNFGHSGSAQPPGGVCPPRVFQNVSADGAPLPRREAKLQIAVYKLTALPLPGSTGPAPQLRVFGLGAGEQAVGSIAIDQVTFQPSTIHPQANEFANFGFHVHSAFDGVRAGFAFTALYNGHVLLEEEKDQEEKLPPIPEGERGRGIWKGKGKPGEHMLQVRAWRGMKSGGDWVVAWSPDIVDVVQ